MKIVRPLILAGALAATLGLGCKDNKPAPGAADAAAAAQPAPDARPSMAQQAAPDAGPDAAPSAAAGAEPDAGTEAALATPDAGEAPSRPTGKSVGVEACDTYLDRMARCITKLSPESAEPLKAAMEDSRRAWQQTAATAEGKAALVDACGAALEAAKSAAESMGCSW